MDSFPRQLLTGVRVHRASIRNSLTIFDTLESKHEQVNMWSMQTMETAEKITNTQNVDMTWNTHTRRRKEHTRRLMPSTWGDVTDLCRDTFPKSDVNLVDPALYDVGNVPGYTRERLFSDGIGHPWTELNFAADWHVLFSCLFLSRSWSNFATSFCKPRWRLSILLFESRSLTDPVTRPSCERFCMSELLHGVSIDFWLVRSHVAGFGLCVPYSKRWGLVGPRWSI